METPICSECQISMYKIGETGRQTQLVEWDEELEKIKPSGIRDDMLYQCPQCKTIKIQ